jgi:hypothetical protein
MFHGRLIGSRPHLVVVVYSVLGAMKGAMNV